MDQNGSKWPTSCDWVLKTILILSFHFCYTVVNEKFLYPSFLPSTFISSPLTNERSWQFECACKWRCSAFICYQPSQQGTRNKEILSETKKMQNFNQWIWFRSILPAICFNVSDIGMFPHNTAIISRFWPGPVRENPSTKHRESMRIDLGRCGGVAVDVSRGIWGRIVQPLQGLAMSFWEFVLRVGISWGFWVSCCMRWFFVHWQTSCCPTLWREVEQMKWSEINNELVNIEDCFHNTAGIFFVFQHILEWLVRQRSFPTMTTLPWRPDSRCFWVQECATNPKGRGGEKWQTIEPKFMVASLKFIILNWPRNVRPFCRPIFLEKKTNVFSCLTRYVCIETLRLVATCNGLDCSGLDDAKAPPVQWVGKLNTGCTRHLWLSCLGLKLACFEVIVLCDEQLEQVGWTRSFAYVQHCLTNMST